MGDEALPKAALEKLIRQHLGSKRATTDLKEAISACCTDMIHMLAAQANSITEDKKRKTITPEDVVAALKQLGFESYVPAAEATMGQVKEAAKVQRQRKANVTAQKKAMLTDEMKREQEKMLAEARKAIQGTTDEVPEQQPEADDADDFSLGSGLFG